LYFHPSAAHEVPAPFAAEAVKFLCVTDLLPPAVLAGDGFARFASALSASSPSGDQFVPLTSELLVKELESLHTRVSNCVAETLLTGVEAGIALSVELWNDNSFVSVAARFVDRVSFTPTVLTLLVHYSGPEIRSDGSARDVKLSSGCDECREKDPDGRTVCAVSKALQEWNIDPSVVISVTTQSASLSCAQVERTCGIKTHFTCVGTVLASVIGGALHKHRDVIKRAESALGVNVSEVEPRATRKDMWLSDFSILSEVLGRISSKDDRQPQQPQQPPLLFQPSDSDVAVATALANMISPAAVAAERIILESGQLSLSSERALLAEMLALASNTSLGGRDRSVLVPSMVRETAFSAAQELSDAISVLSAEPSELALLCSALDKTVNPEGAALSLLLDRYDNAEVYAYLLDDARMLAGDQKTELFEWWSARRGRFPGLERAACAAMAVPVTAVPAARAFPDVSSIQPNKEMVVAMRRLGLCRLSDVSAQYIQTVVYLNANLQVFEASQE
jgi:hAT family C-terminal dimerisation region